MRYFGAIPRQLFNPRKLSKQQQEAGNETEAQLAQTQSEVQKLITNNEISILPEDEYEQVQTQNDSKLKFKRGYLVSAGLEWAH